MNGKCTHAITGGCLIDGKCFKDGDLEPGTECHRCDTKTSSTSWTVAVSLCSISGGLSCASTSCKSGKCATEISTGYCLVDGACIAEGSPDPKNGCQVCDTSISTTSLQVKKDGSTCTTDNQSCTSDLCKSGKCTHTLKADSCLIAGKCHDKGAIHPSGDCSFCNPKKSTTSWTAIKYEGCCGGDVVWYCSSGSLKNISCSTNPSCGWNSSYSYYDCGTSGSTDPAGSHPKSCF